MFILKEEDFRAVILRARVDVGFKLKGGEVITAPRTVFKHVDSPRPMEFCNYGRIFVLIVEDFCWFIDGKPKRAFELFEELKVENYVYQDFDPREFRNMVEELESVVGRKR